MKDAFGRRMRLLALIAGAVLVVSVGVANSAIPGSDGEIDGCYAKNGSLRVIDAEDGETCKKNETALSWSQRGPKGDKGDKGDPGAPGANAPAEEYGVAIVRVQRGAGAATPWAVYSTELGSPVGDTTGGTFRFTCTPAHETCRVSVQAKILSDSSVAPGTIHPRVLIYRGGDPDSSVEPEFYCEYGDGTAQPVTRKPKADATPTGDPVSLHIGGSADCGLAGPAGLVTEIVVPKGYYDVFSTFQIQQ
jgi:hypothetical protein